MRFVRVTVLLLVTAALAGCAGGDGADAPNPTATIETNHGPITVELFARDAPQTVQNFGDLAQDGFYNGTRFHRVIDGFMIQGGDQLSKDDQARDRWGTGGPGYSIVDEFACQDGTISNQWTGYRSSQEPCDGHGGPVHSHDAAGTLSMANSGQPKTGGSQFFITLDATRHLDGTHTVFGQVTDGLAVVQEIGQVPTGDNDRPREDVTVTSVTIDGELPGVEVEHY